MRRLLPPMLVLALAFAGCGDDETTSTQPSPGTTEETPTAAAESETPEASESGDVVQVAMKNIAFDPEEVTLKVGQTIRWTNEDSVQHDADFTSGAEFESDLVGKGGTVEYTAEKAGTIEYICSVHPNMKGTITVEE